MVVIVLLIIKRPTQENSRKDKVNQYFPYIMQVDKYIPKPAVFQSSGIKPSEISFELVV